MGLDQYVFKIKKIREEDKEKIDRAKTIDQLIQDGFNAVYVEDYRAMTNFVEPYVYKTRIMEDFDERILYELGYLDADFQEDVYRINAFHFNVPKDGLITVSIGGSYTDMTDEKVISAERFKKIGKECERDIYVYRCSNAYCWRKDYEISKWFRNHIGQPVENCGHYAVDEGVVYAAVDRDRDFMEVLDPTPLDADEIYAYFEWW